MRFRKCSSCVLPHARPTRSAPSWSSSLLLKMRFRKCSSCVLPHARPTSNRRPAITVQKTPGPPDSLTAEPSWQASTTQPRIRATILGTLHFPGADSHHERQSTLPTLRYLRIATMMKDYEFVLQNAVNLLLEPLRSVRSCE